VLQTKLAINQPGDEYEQKADRISQQVMRMPEPKLQRACACGGGCPKCQMQQPGRELESLHTKRVHASDTGQIAAPPIVHEVLRSSGQPLDPATRAFMEPRFGHDFSHVRVHTDERAGASSHAVHALAYTAGRHLVFGTGQYSPTIASGRRLLAHELAHTIQQSSLGSGKALQRAPAGSSKMPTTPLEPLEAVAQRIARLALGPNQAIGQFYRGPVLTVVRDVLSDEIFVGLNTGIPQKLTDVIDRAIEAQKARISSGEVTLIHCAGYLVHPFSENDEFFGRMYQVASTGVRERGKPCPAPSNLSSTSPQPGNFR
jgi:hypothetical protein